MLMMSARRVEPELDDLFGWDYSSVPLPKHAVGARYCSRSAVRRRIGGSCPLLYVPVVCISRYRRALALLRRRVGTGLREGPLHRAIVILRGRGCVCGRGRRHQRCLRIVFPGRRGFRDMSSRRAANYPNHCNTSENCHSKINCVFHMRPVQALLSDALGWSSGTWSKASGRATVGLDQIRTRFLC
jgi:hypothetical protein